MIAANTVFIQHCPTDLVHEKLRAADACNQRKSLALLLFTKVLLIDLCLGIGVCVCSVNLRVHLYVVHAYRIDLLKLF